MPKIVVKYYEQGKKFENAIRRFNRAVEKADVISDFRKHEFFEKKSEKKKRARAAAIKRAQREN